MVEDRNRLNGGVERIIQKTDRDETLREVCGALTKLEPISKLPTAVDPI
jgi:hypothetical protein